MMCLLYTVVVESVHKRGIGKLDTGFCLNLVW